MTSAKIIHDGSGWRLRDEDILLWCSVEFVMLKTIMAIGSRQLVSLDHVVPHWPEVFGYKRLHSAEKFAHRAKTASLNAFQRMLAYCSYMIANTTILRVSPDQEKFQLLLSNPGQMDHLFKVIGSDAPDTDIHVIVKFLWATLSEIHRTSNFIGVVVHYQKPYDYPSVRAMKRHGVPVYVCWDSTLKLETYSKYNQHHMLQDWAPNSNDFRALQQPPPSIINQPPLNNKPPDLEVLQGTEDDFNDNILHLDRVCPDPKDSGGTHLGHISQVPFFCNDAVAKHLGAQPFKVSEWDVANWHDDSDFLAKRYGITETLGVVDTEKDKLWCKKLGLAATHPDESAVQLYDAVAHQGQWPPLICDLSPDMISVPEVFPSNISGNILAVSNTEDGYIVEIQDGQPHPWKLLISDPLTILQIERELWCLNGRGLVTNLIKKGLPFKILHTACHEATGFLDSPGPIPHPTEREPRLIDYFAYRRDLVDFLQTYPHAHAAALCAGGILWRTTVDVLPLPSEDTIVGPFHRAVCSSHVFNGVRYWTPKLTIREEQVIVGVYRWAKGKLLHSVGGPY